MKNKILFMTSVILLVLLLASCSTLNAGSANTGTITFINIPEELNDKYVVAGGSEDFGLCYFSASKPNNGRVQGVKISGGEVTLNVFVTKAGSDIYTSFTGSADLASIFFVTLKPGITKMSSSGNDIEDFFYSISTITFSDGNAIVDFAAQMKKR